MVIWSKNILFYVLGQGSTFQRMMSERKKCVLLLLNHLGKNVGCVFLTLAKWNHCTGLYMIELSLVVYLAAAACVTVPFFNCFVCSLHGVSEHCVFMFLYCSSVFTCERIFHLLLQLSVYAMWLCTEKPWKGMPLPFGSAFSVKYSEFCC